ncbi:hypothetical protein GCM10010377_50540 [Streptomyces viridiviolaceus]|uniref:DUF1684 domain-containing protein n=1 Tax=Streptomyces viridiviolaceus TaxID=68282 RepID=A0ABW2E9J8_9ACTN|nr:DUF1684 domain-containing protein [Streptomyces viridiviolaceus]GHB53385.1 hypothetical protein GCM10010377_50540 [Streptomyces viridiviolaceus]
MTTNASDEWKRWHDRRVATVSAPYGPLALTGTHWLEDHPDGRLPDVPGRWAADGDAVVLTAARADGLTVDGRPLDGRARLTADRGPADGARVAYGERRLVVLVREGVWGVRDFDPAAEARRDFRGIEATPHDPRWSVPGRFTPYEAGRRSVRVPNADGRERGLGLGGELAFTLPLSASPDRGDPRAGRELTLQVTVEEDGSLWAVFADSTSGKSSYRFRFLRPPAPDAEGRTTVDFNRALLPPCAFADHFICPFPPPGNTLDAGIEAGERQLL